ncbi:MAG TPA: hypothetical protein VKA84_15445 [Gemmatimonadaceae bacterium]|nr:hypothetical protein [Gemmatimonadaceae bacterium]
MSSRFAAALAAVATAALLAGAAGAQAIPNPAAPKAAAKRAAAATNAHTEAMSNPSSAQPQPQQQQPPAPAKGAQQQRPTRAATGRDSAARTSTSTSASQSRGSVSVSERGGRGQITLAREVFDYDPNGRRDPFVSLMASGELRPIMSDLQLKTIIYDASGRNSVAVLRDAQTKEQYRVRVGQTIGRMRVTAIRPREVVFTIDEFGFNRQEVLTYSEPTPRKP